MESGAFASFLAFAGYMYFLTSWLDRLFDVNSRQRLALGLEIAGNLGSLVALTLTLAISGSALKAVAAFTVTEVTYSSIWLYFAYRVAGFKTGALRKFCVDFVVTGLPMVAFLGLVHAFIHGWWALVVSAIGLFAIEGFIYFRYVRGDLASLFHLRTISANSGGQKSPLHGNDSSEFYQNIALEPKGFSLWSYLRRCWKLDAATAVCSGTWTCQARITRASTSRHHSLNYFVLAIQNFNCAALKDPPSWNRAVNTVLFFRTAWSSISIKKCFIIILKMHVA